MKILKDRKSAIKSIAFDITNELRFICLITVCCLKK